MTEAEDHLTQVTFEGKVVRNLDLHVEGKMLWAKVTLEDGRKFDVEVQKADKNAVVEIGAAAHGG